MSKRTFRLKDGTLSPHDAIAGIYRIVRRVGQALDSWVAPKPISYAAGGRRSASTDVGRDSQALSEIRVILGLTEAELADLFDVRRESIVGWRKNGIPDARRASVARVFDVARVLHRMLQPERIPQVVRTHDDWLEDGTILKTIRTGHVDTIYAYLRRLASYTPE